jgi:TetR/AcrR family transcriptional regulator, tetracycline repressor protein
MKINRDMVTRAALKLLNEVGLERLTLRHLGRELKVQAPTIYWHFKSKEALIDEMATLVQAEGPRNWFPRKSRRSGTCGQLPSERVCERRSWTIAMAQR